MHPCVQTLSRSLSIIFLGFIGSDRSISCSSDENSLSFFPASLPSPWQFWYRKYIQIYLIDPINPPILADDLYYFYLKSLNSSPALSKPSIYMLTANAALCGFRLLPEEIITYSDSPISIVIDLRKSTKHSPIRIEKIPYLCRKCRLNIGYILYRSSA